MIPIAFKVNLEILSIWDDYKMLKDGKKHTVFPDS